MHHYSSLKELHASDAWVTIGTFDGVHLGHQSIIQNMVAGAKDSSAPAFVITFHPHPAVFLKKVQSTCYLTSPDERAGYLLDLGVSGVVTLDFNENLAHQSAREFIESLSKATHLRHLWVGYDFALGHDRHGNSDVLTSLGQEYGFEVHVFSPVKKDSKVISSSQIRKWVAAGEMNHAAKWLGRWYSVQGRVIHGDGRGRLLGIPTANLQVWPEKCLPEPGVYTAWANIQNHKWMSVLNLGFRPTFNEKALEPRLEVHVLDLSADLYDQQINLELVQRLRPEQRFSSLDLLVAQIHQDIQTTREVLANVP